MATLYTTSLGMIANDFHSGVVASVSDKCPLIGLMPEGKTVKNWDDKWAVESFPTGDNPAVGEGVDKIAGFTSQVPYYLEGKCQIFRSAGWHVSKQKADGLNKSAEEVANAKAKQQALDSRNLLVSTEKVIGSMQEAAEVTTTVVTRYTRGMPQWLSPNAHAVQDVNAAVRPTAAQWYNGSFESFSEDKLREMLLACALQRKGPVALMGFVGLELKQKMSYFTTKVEKSDALTDVRSVNMENGRKFSMMVDLFEFDGCSVKAVWMPRLFCDSASAGMPETDYTTTSGIFPDMSMWELAYFNRMAHIDCSKLDTGAGPRGYHEFEARLRCLNPMGQAVAYMKKMAG